MNKQQFQQAVLAQLNGNKDHGWGSLDSLEVIKKIVKAVTGKDLTPEAEGQVKSLVNPSAFRQILEDQKVLNESVKGSKKTKRDFLQFVVETVVKTPEVAKK